MCLPVMSRFFVLEVRGHWGEPYSGTCWEDRRLTKLRSDKAGDKGQAVVNTWSLVGVIESVRNVLNYCSAK